MSGIAGLWWLDGRPVDKNHLMRAVEAMAHRGPDGSGVTVEGHIGLGHRLLKTTPEDKENHQPLVRGPLTLTADARIDNRAELLTKLRGTVSARSTDAEFILAAYARWGREAPMHLVGAFAFALWDAQRRRLFCARDVMGVRPFYYHYVPGQCFAFASEVNALHALDLVPRALDEEMVALYLAAPGPYMKEARRTTLKGIQKLPRNTRMVLGEETPLQEEAYWAPPAEPLELKDNAAYAEAFRAVFSEAVESRLRASTPVGSMLSGGLDSSSITCLARSLAPKSSLPLHTYSAIYPDLIEESGGLIDEREYMEAVASLDGIKPHYMRADKLGPFYEFDDVVQAFGQLYFGGNAFFHLRAVQLCNQHGNRVLLDGADGDSVVSHGTGFARALLRQGAWDTFKQATGMKGKPGKGAWAYFNAYGGWEHLDTLASQGRLLEYWRQSFAAARALGLQPWEMGAGPGASPLSLVTAPLQKWLTAQRAPADGPSLPDGDLLAAELLTAHHDFLMDRVRPSPSAVQQTKIEQRWHGLQQFQHVMETLDVLAAQHQVEMRYPFFDRRVLECCLALPGLQQRQNGLGRFILRAAMEGILPEKVRLREDKGNLSAGFTNGFLRLNPDFVARAINAPAVVLQHYIDTPHINDLRKAILEGETTAKGRALGLYRVVALSRWLKTVAQVNGRSPS